MGRRGKRIKKKKRKNLEAREANKVKRITPGWRVKYYWHNQYDEHYLTTQYILGQDPDSVQENACYWFHNLENIPLEAKLDDICITREDESFVTYTELQQN